MFFTEDTGKMGFVLMSKYRAALLQINRKEVITFSLREREREEKQPKAM